MTHTDSPTGELDFPCPTCRAQPGQPCNKRGNLSRGGPSHLTRVDRYIRARARAIGAAPWREHRADDDPVWRWTPRPSPSPSPHHTEDKDK